MQHRPLYLRNAIADERGLAGDDGEKMGGIQGSVNGGFLYIYTGAIDDR